MNRTFDQLTDRIVKQALPRRSAMRRMGKAGVGLAVSAIPVLKITNTALARTRQPINADGVTDVLNFALTLEFLEESFYRQGLAASGLIPSGDRAVFQQIQKHEDAHVSILQATITSLGGTPVSLTDSDFDFTAGNGSGTGALDPFNDYATFMALAQGFEDTGVRAYKGQAPNLMGAPDVLDAALRIHSVEARHAAQVRRMRGQQGWIPNADTGLPAGFEAIYAGEDTITQGGINLGSVSSVDMEEITESFDEPLTMAAVLAIADPFVAG